MTVHSNDGLTWDTRIKRIGQLSAQDKDLVFTNLGHLITSQMLKDLYLTLDGRKAVGIDLVTKQNYGDNLDVNVKDLILRIRRGTYRPQAIRIVEIPKDNGEMRALAISCFEDKLVQLAVSTILSTIYEPLFLPCSFGYRPHRNCHDALRALNRHAYRNWDGACVEIDISQFFDTIPHLELEEFLTTKISDKGFMRLITILLRPQIHQNNTLIENTVGCPQGSILSPILSNIFLHHVIDEWFDDLKQNHFKGVVEEVRFADDMVFIFGKDSEAQQFFKVLPKRLNKYGLDIKDDKSKILPCGNLAVARLKQNGLKIPTFNFLGFTCYWGRTKTGIYRLMYSSRRDRFSAKLKALRIYLRRNLTTHNTQALMKSVIRMIRGWVNYHGISDNQRRVSSFLHRAKRTILMWFRRRSQKNNMLWQTLNAMLVKLGFPFKWKTVSMFVAPR